MKESVVKATIRRTLANSDDIRLFNNPVGQAWLGKAYPGTTGAVVIKEAARVAFGLQKGSGDLIGWKSITVTPDMVGRKLAVFLSIETKASKGKVRPDQHNWAAQVRKAGGLAGIARSVEEAYQITEEI